MNSCAKCQYPIPDGEEVWLRNRKSNKRVPLCSQCAAELRQKRAKPEPAATEMAAPITSSAMSMPSSKSSKTPIDSILTMIILLLVAAPILGILLGLIGNYLYLIILFPIGTGFVSGFILNQGVRWGKLRDPMVAGIFGLLFGLAVYGSYRVTGYVMFRNEVKTMLIDEMMAEFGESDAEVADLVIDEILYEQTGATGFFGFVLLEGQEGMSVGRAGFSSAINVGSFLTYLYWLFEAGTMIGIPIFMGMSEAKRPFCESHDRWYDSEKSLGGITPGNIKATLALLDAGQFKEFGQALDSLVPIPGIEIAVERCPGCEQSSPLLTIKQLKRTSRGKKDETVLAQKYISPAQCDELQRSIELAQT